jgi:hypothetical protein
VNKQTKLLGKDEILVSIDEACLWENDDINRDIDSDNFIDGETYTIYKKVRDVVFSNTPQFVDKKKR